MKKKMEFSKKVVIALTVIEALLTVFCCVMVWVTRDMSPLAYLIPSIATTSSTGVAFYYNKAKLENKIKLMQSMGVEPTEMSFNEMNGGI